MEDYVNKKIEFFGSIPKNQKCLIIGDWRTAKNYLERTLGGLGTCRSSRKANTDHNGNKLHIVLRSSDENSYVDLCWYRNGEIISHGEVSEFIRKTIPRPQSTSKSVELVQETIGILSSPRIAYERVQMLTKSSPKDGTTVDMVKSAKKRRKLFEEAKGEDVMEDLSKIPTIVNDGKRCNVIISDKCVMSLIIGGTSNVHGLNRPLNIDYTEMKSPSMNILVTSVQIPFIRNKRGEMIQVYGPMMVGTHQGNLDIRDMGVHMQSYPDHMPIAVMSDDTNLYRGIVRPEDNTIHLKCYVHKRRNIEDKCKALNIDPKHQCEIIFGNRHWRGVGENMLVQGIVGTDNVQEFKQLVGDSPLHEEIKLYLLAQAESFCTSYSNEAKRKGGFNEYERATTNCLEAANSSIKKRFAEQMKNKPNTWESGISVLSWMQVM
ncbi:uncharacterized protein LOC111700498 isoform X2 [Eurytemora carolleeae]|uniref:uncharacterized protein LOC111700498 isoform X2 n=1 Tax=Eurytemora carolleeae TaxID=1294199 RepID=UPI000C7618F3|nr:uncharacterized protein LOC111700498 isoform X2 [Eurytemora carolleeae]|eukprot:XP_023327198.1 uncharacterized protein LOC111700498 isoform X2 [Eurytemora affinis]